MLERVFGEQIWREKREVMIKKDMMRRRAREKSDKDRSGGG